MDQRAGMARLSFSGPNHNSEMEHESEGKKDKERKSIDSFEVFAKQSGGENGMALFAEMQRLQEELRTTRREKGLLKQKLSVAESRCESLQLELEHERENSQAEREKKRQDAVKQTESVSELREKLEEWEEKYEQAAQQLDVNKSNTESLRVELEERDEQMQQLSAMLAQREKELHVLRSQYVNTVKGMHDTKQKLDREWRNTLTAIESKQKSLKDDNMKLRKAIEAQRSHYQNLLGQRNKLLDDLERRICAYRQKIKALTNTLNTAKMNDTINRVQLESDLKDEQRKSKELRSRVASMERQLQECTEKLRETEVQAKHFHAEFDRLANQHMETLESIKSQHRLELEKQRFIRDSLEDQLRKKADEATFFQDQFQSQSALLNTLDARLNKLNETSSNFNLVESLEP